MRAVSVFEACSSTYSDNGIPIVVLLCDSVYCVPYYGSSREDVFRYNITNP